MKTLLLALALSGCEMADDLDDPGATTNASLSATAADSLYNRLGGERILRGVVNRYFTLAISDPQLNLSRKGMPGASMKWLLSAAPTWRFHAKHRITSTPAPASRLSAPPARSRTRTRWPA